MSEATRKPMGMIYPGQKIAELCGENAKLRALVPEWQAIETAPTNASVLVFIPSAEHYGPGIYRAILVNMGWGTHWHASAWAMGRDLPREATPTHWMPLPTPPTRED